MEILEHHNGRLPPRHVAQGALDRRDQRRLINFSPRHGKYNAAVAGTAAIQRGLQPRPLD